jgi:ribosomal protein S18 acetylase RimI-like enzyme
MNTIRHSVQVNPEAVGSCAPSPEISEPASGEAVGETRRACPADIQALVALCRAAFPWTAKWGLAPSFTARWYWKAVLDSEACEAWILAAGDNILGFYVLMLDPRRWTVDRNARRGSLAVRLFLLLLRPHALLEAIAARVRGAFRGRGRGHQTAQKRVLDAWADWMAVDTRLRSRGVGRTLVRHWEARCRRHGRSVIRLDVFRRNRRAQAFFLREGYELTSSTSYCCKFSKELETDKRVASNSG